MVKDPIDSKRTALIPLLQTSSSIAYRADEAALRDGAPHGIDHPGHGSSAQLMTLPPSTL
jgi:hypothetical protein